MFLIFSGSIGSRGFNFTFLVVRTFSLISAADLVNSFSRSSFDIGLIFGLFACLVVITVPPYATGERYRRNSTD